jgi:hypothetical protein
MSPGHRHEQPAAPQQQGGTIRIRVRNPSKRSVRVCDRLPAGLTYVTSKATAKLTKSGYSRRPRPSGPARRRPTASPCARSAAPAGREVNRATANSTGANTADATRTTHVLAARVLGGGVTG